LICQSVRCSSSAWTTMTCSVGTCGTSSPHVLVLCLHRRHTKPCDRAPWHRYQRVFEGGVARAAVGSSCLSCVSEFLLVRDGHFLARAIPEVSRRAGWAGMEYDFGRADIGGFGSIIRTPLPGCDVSANYTSEIRPADVITLCTHAQVCPPRERL
jgi:hypothetical protein